MKFSFIQENCCAWPVRVMCAVLGISVSGYYAWRSRVASKRATANRQLLDQIQRIHTDSSGTYGSPRIHGALRRTGQPVGRSRVETLMRRARLRGLAALPRRTRTTDSRHSYPIAPNRLARNFTAQKPNQVWLADLTYIPTGQGWLYLAAILDRCTRKIVGSAQPKWSATQLNLSTFSGRIKSSRTLCSVLQCRRRYLCHRNLPCRALLRHSNPGS